MGRLMFPSKRWLTYINAHAHLTKKEEVVRNVKVKGSLGCSDNEMVEFKIPRVERRVQKKLPILNFRKAYFGLFRGLPGDQEKRGPRKLVDIQGSPPLSSGALHPNKEVRQEHQ